MSHGEAIAMATHARVLHNIPASGSIGTGSEAKEVTVPYHVRRSNLLAPFRNSN